MLTYCIGRVLFWSLPQPPTPNFFCYSDFAFSHIAPIPIRLLWPYGIQM